MPPHKWHCTMRNNRLEVETAHERADHCGACSPHHCPIHTPPPIKITHAGTLLLRAHALVYVLNFLVRFKFICIHGSLKYNNSDLGKRIRSSGLHSETDVHHSPDYLTQH